MVYLKLIFPPALFYILILLAYLDIIHFKLSLSTLVMTGLIFFTALIFVRHNAQYAYHVFEQQKDDFKQALKRHIMKHFLVIEKDTKSNANFDDFAHAYIQDIRNENFASMALFLFPMMGIFGTFISLAFSMPNFNSTDTLALEQEIADLLSGVGTAFCVSIYGIFLALWWVFFEKQGKSKIACLLNRQKKSTSDFFWTKEEIEQRYLSQSLGHFEKIAAIFKQVSDKDFFVELDRSIDRKLGIFEHVLNAEEKAVRLSTEHIKQTMTELSKTQKDHKDLAKLYTKMLNAIALLNQNLKEISTRMFEQYNRLLDVSSDKIDHFDKTLSAFDERIERFCEKFELYEKAMLQSQEKLFQGFKMSLFEARDFKEVYEEERSIDAKIKMMDELKKEIKALDEETSQIMTKWGKEKSHNENEKKDFIEFKGNKNQELKQANNNDLENEENK